MSLEPAKLYLGRLVGYHGGRSVYELDCCATDTGIGAEAQKRLVRLVGYHGGRPLYEANCCDEPFHLAKLVGYHGGRPVYMFAEPCCLSAGSGSGSGSGSSGTADISIECACNPMPATLHVTLTSNSVQCDCLDGTTLTLVYRGRVCNDFTVFPPIDSGNSCAFALICSTNPAVCGVDDIDEAHIWSDNLSDFSACSQGVACSPTHTTPGGSIGACYRCCLDGLVPQHDSLSIACCHFAGPNFNTANDPGFTCNPFHAEWTTAPPTGGTCCLVGGDPLTQIFTVTLTE